MRTEPKFTNPHGERDPFLRRDVQWLGPYPIAPGKDCDLYILESYWYMAVWGERQFASSVKNNWDRDMARPAGLMAYQRDALGEFRDGGLESRGPIAGVTREQAIAAIRACLLRERARGVQRAR